MTSPAVAAVNAMAASAPTGSAFGGAFSGALGGLQHHASSFSSPVDAARGYAHALEKARLKLDASFGPQATPPLGEVMGVGSIGEFANRLSEVHAKNLQALESLTRLDPLAPDSPAKMMGVFASMTKSSIQTDFTTKFASKISEGLNRLLNT